jgi:hypothetical protein
MVILEHRSLAAALAALVGIGAAAFVALPDGASDRGGGATVTPDARIDGMNV